MFSSLQNILPILVFTLAEYGGLYQIILCFLFFFSFLSLATVTNNKDDIEKIYDGLCKTAFEERYWNHTSYFRHEDNRNQTELSSYIWALKKDKIVPSIKWKILRIVRGKPTSNYCRLCLTEKFFIINSIGDNRVLNKRSEFVNKCRHQNKYLIKNVKLKDSIDSHLSAFIYIYKTKLKKEP